MKRLNNKGYMIVEIIVSATIAMTIAYFMMDLIVKLKEKYDYVQNDTILMTDKTVITNEILGDLYKREKVCAISGDLNIDGKTDNIVYKILDSNGDVTNNWLRLSYNSADKKIIYEESLDGGINYTLFYQKKFSDSLQINMTSDESTNDVKISVENSIASFIINAETLTSKKNYGINIIIPVNGVCS